MSTRSLVAVTVCACFGILVGAERPLRAHAVTDSPAAQTPAERSGPDDPGPIGVIFAAEPPAGQTTAFTCQVGVRSLLSGEGILLEKFPAEPGKATTFRKTSKGLTVEVEATIAAGGSSVEYSITVTTSEHRPLGIYAARLKLRT